ncbi:MAG TPA: pyruvate dehydrogenase (acetyl-transferring) E1 component subunit alpha [Planctomycetota bacterium]|nr:pyruvate dehydrogenase (acetyl-transferring) E1 component subunit alpha [Planctomycetota bacterium]
MAETQTDKAQAEDEVDGREPRDYPSPSAPAQDPNWEREAKPNLSKEERTMGLPREKLRQMMYDMLLGRRFEEKTAEAYALGRIGGFCHLYIGQEAVAIGGIHALEKDDYVITAYREHVHALQMGIEPEAVMAELYGRIDGCSKGKGGSMHMFSAATNYLGGHGIVGGQIPLALGVAWKIKYRGEDRVMQVYLGEAAVNQGAFHESLNMAALWQLPLVVIVENNRFGMGTAWERASSLYDISQKASAYAMPSGIADGMDILDMYRVTSEAVDRARSGGGPTLIEARTYRFVGHSMSDPVSGVYRTKEEVEEEKLSDPIRIYANLLADLEMLSQEELEQMDAEVKEISEKAADFAEKSPEPEIEELYRDVYAEEDVAGRLYFDGRR